MSKPAPLLYPVVCNIRMPIQCVAFSNTSRLGAVGCASQLKIVKIDNANSISEVCNFNNIPLNATLMGVSWSPLDPTQLAVCFSNGTLCSLQVHEKTPKVAAFAAEAWNSGRVSNCVNKVSWHTSERNIVASANQDGQVKLFDFRHSHNACLVTTWGSKSNIAVRDVAFDPFHSDVFAEVSDSGNLKLWDRRYPALPIMSKISAHSQAILTLDWHPSLSNMLATGSRDKNVKIWDFNACSIDNNAHDDSVLPYGGLAGHHLVHSVTTAEGIEPVLVSTVHTPAAVSRVMWRTGGEINFKNQLATVSVAATISTQASTSGGLSTSGSDSNGHISIWDIDHPNIPICILKGHEADGGCADFQWIESLAGADSTSSASTAAAGGPGSGSVIGTTVAATVASPLSATSATTAAAAASNPGGRTIGKRGSAKSYNFDNYQKSMEAQQQKVQATMTALYILSANSHKEGKLLIQDIRRSHNSLPSNVMYPYDHVSPSVVAISSQGDVAFHRGHIQQSVKSGGGAIPLILTEKDKSAAAETVKKSSVKGGSGKGGSNSHSNNRQSQTPSPGPSAAGNGNTSSSGTGNGAAVVSSSSSASSSSSSKKMPAILSSGRVCFGRAGIENLEESKDIRSERGAEGGVFDPALIYLLARNYSLAHTMYGCEEGDPRRMRGGSYSFHSNDSLSIGESVGAAAAAHCKDQLTPLCLASSSRSSVQRVNSRSTFSLLQQHQQHAGADSACAGLSESDQAALKEFTNKCIRYEEAMEACRINIQVAKSAGLNCRASVWASLAALIPEPVKPVLSSRAAATDKAHRNRPHLPPSSSASSALVSTSTGASSLDELMSLNFAGELPFGLEMLAGMLYELMEGGDTQHFVVMCEILRKAGILKEVCSAGLHPISEFRVRRSYLAYLDLLTKLQLFCEANEIIKASDDAYISSLSKQGVEIHAKCAKCGKEITEKSATAWCVKCARCVCMCALCNRPVSGLLHWCPVCGHGGHLDCMKQWFHLSNTCPSGCGHDCCSSMVQVPPTGAAGGAGNAAESPLNSARVHFE